MLEAVMVLVRFVEANWAAAAAAAINCELNRFKAKLLLGKFVVWSMSEGERDVAEEEEEDDDDDDVDDDDEEDKDDEYGGSKDDNDDGDVVVDVGWWWWLWWWLLVVDDELGDEDEDTDDDDDDECLFDLGSFVLLVCWCIFLSAISRFCLRHLARLFLNQTFEKLKEIDFLWKEITF